VSVFSRFFRKPSPAPVSRAAEPTVADSVNQREAAVQRLADGEELRQLAGVSAPAIGTSDSTPAAVRRAAQLRMAHLIDAGAIDLAGLCDGGCDWLNVVAVAASCEDPARLNQVLASIKDPAQRARLIRDSSISRVRQLAAEAVDDPAELKDLLRQVGSKDKNVYKILKQKNDARNAAQRRAEALANEATLLCDSLERLTRRPFDTLYESAFDQLQTRWRLRAAPAAVDVEARGIEAIERCVEVIAAAQRASERQRAEQAAMAAEREQALAAQESARRAATDAAAATALEEAKIAAEAAVLREAAEAERAKRLAAEERAQRQVAGLIRRANHALIDGQSQRAQAMRRAIDNRLTAFPMPVFLARQLQELDGKLQDLKQWKEFAVAPKRIELIEAMESLIGVDEDPEALAKRIKALQQEWRTTAKGLASDTAAEWERFHQASQAAYEPCRVYFEQQAMRRQENLEQRRAVLERLLAFETALPAEDVGRLVMRVLREAPVEWRRHFPVDRAANQPLQAEFDAAMGRLRARLDAWHATNVADKQSLIKRARHVLGLQDAREAVESIKKLQLLWKETGPVPREVSDALWTEFREVCDAVFQKRHQAQAEFVAGLEANRQAAVAVCEEAERVASLTGMELIDGVAKIPEWRAVFDALGELPKGEARQIQNRFARALELCSSRVKQQQDRDADRAEANLLEAARLVSAYQMAVVEHSAASVCETLKQAAEAFIAGARDWPKGGVQAVKDALLQAEATDVDWDARERALRMLCIRAEIQGDIATPSEDDALRREYQVQRLMQGMGQGSRVDEDWHTMLLEWIRNGAVSPPLQERLQGRFMYTRRSRRHD
jgi:hypothetical protein